MTALLVASFTGWDWCGVLLWAGIIAYGWYWAVKDRKHTIAEMDRQWARRNRL